MKSVFKTSIALLALAALSATARTPGAVEDGKELEPSMLTLPSTIDGTLAVQGCSACKRRTYTMSPDVKFYVAKQEVSFAEFKRYIGAHPEAALLLVTPVNQNIVTRLSAP
jgi:hypothetical protein